MICVYKIEKYMLWYEGAHDFAPSTNNPNESMNAHLKKKYLNRRQVNFYEFLAISKKNMYLNFFQNHMQMATEMKTHHCGIPMPNILSRH